MRDGVALAGRRAQLAADVGVGDALRDDLVEPVLHERAGAHVLRLFLDPEDLLQVRVAAEQLLELLLRERVEQLDARYRDVARRRALLVADEVVVDLSAAENETRNLFALARQR